MPYDTSLPPPTRQRSPSILLLLLGCLMSLVLRRLLRKPVVFRLIKLHQYLHQTFQPMCPVCIEYLRGMTDQWKDGERLSQGLSLLGRQNGHSLSSTASRPGTLER